MYAYGTRASLGDDVYYEPCTKSLEEHVAKLTGKEAGLFLPSGTMSNQIAIRAHLKESPYSILLDRRSHIYLHEAAGTAFFSGAREIPVLPANGEYDIRIGFQSQGQTRASPHYI
jgi:threonine aldolase